MLSESTKQDLREMTDLLKSMDSVSMMIIKSNAAVLLARQELAESRGRQGTSSEVEGRKDTEQISCKVDMSKQKTALM